MTFSSTKKVKTIGKDYVMGKTIGKGTFGKVHEGTHLPTREKVAIKVLQKKRIKNSKDQQRVQRQLQILQKLSHPFIVKILQVKETAGCIYIITQLAEGEELYETIVRRGKLPLQECLRYFTQLYIAVRFLHQNNISHRDIKPENIIVSKEGLKLIDFGLSAVFTEYNYCMYTPCGSPCYAAPEMVAETGYDTRKVDIWALGVTLYAMLAGKLPYEHVNTRKLYKMIEKNQFQEIKGVPQYLNLLLRATIEKNPQLRICMEDIADNLWIKGQLVRQEQILRQRENWNVTALQETAVFFSEETETIQQRVSENNLKPEATFYHLVREKYRKRSRNTNFHQIHRGPFHLEFVFKNIDHLVKYLEGLKVAYQIESVERIKGEFPKEFAKTIRVGNKSYPIKRVENLPQFLYFPFQFLDFE